MVVKRINFDDCSIFTSERSLQSIVESVAIAVTFRDSEICILDAFCGDGIVGQAVSNYLSRHGKRYSLTFADNNPAVLSEEKLRVPKCETRVADLTHSSNLGAFNLITTRYGLHDLSLEDKEKAVKCLAEMLIPDGNIVICDIMPSARIQKELTRYHQDKEDLCDGQNKNVYLASPQEYLALLKKYGITASVQDVFLQETYLRNWLETLGVKEGIVRTYEQGASKLSPELRETCQVFDHPQKGVKMYYPVSTILGVKR